MLQFNISRWQDHVLADLPIQQTGQARKNPRKEPGSMQDGKPYILNHSADAVGQTTRPFVTERPAALAGRLIEKGTAGEKPLRPVRCTVPPSPVETALKHCIDGIDRAPLFPSIGALRADSLGQKRLLCTESDSLARKWSDCCVLWSHVSKLLLSLSVCQYYGQCTKPETGSRLASIRLQEQVEWTLERRDPGPFAPASAGNRIALCRPVCTGDQAAQGISDDTLSKL